VGEYGNWFSYNLMSVSLFSTVFGQEWEVVLQFGINKFSTCVVCLQFCILIRLGIIYCRYIYKFSKLITPQILHGNHISFHYISLRTGYAAAEILNSRPADVLCATRVSCNNVILLDGIVT
jgi:hypothetical protein